MNNYNEYRISKTAPKRLTKKELQEIDRRRLYALRLNDYNDIIEAKQKVLGIIDKDGLDNEEQKVRLDTSLKVLPYIIPQKKAIEMTVTSKSIEDIIKEDIEEAKIISDTKTDTPKNE